MEVVNKHYVAATICSYIDDSILDMNAQFWIVYTLIAQRLSK